MRGCLEEAYFFGAFSSGIFSFASASKSWLRFACLTSCIFGE